MDELDRRLLAAWERVRGQLLADAAGRAEAVRRFERYIGSQLARPLRAWSLVLRANDTRIEDWVADSGFRGQAEGLETLIPTHPLEGAYRKSTGALWLAKPVVGALCSPVTILWPGVRVVEAARRLGVSRATVWRWSKPGGRKPPPVAGPFGEPTLQRTEGRLLVRDVYVNRSDRKRDDVRFWTRRAVDPGGQVFSGPWGTNRWGLANLVPAGFEQVVIRQPRRVTAISTQWQWVCPACERWVYKLYRPMPVWTIPAALGSEVMAAGAGCAVGLSTGSGDGRFVCRRCAGLVYESSEAHWRPGRAGQAVAWDRFVKRISAGMLRGGDVDSAGILMGRG